MDVLGVFVMMLVHQETPSIFTARFFAAPLLSVQALAFATPLLSAQTSAFATPLFTAHAPALGLCWSLLKSVLPPYNMLPRHPHCTKHKQTPATKAGA